MWRRSRPHSMDVLTSPAFGPLLQRYRLAAGLTQEALAERADVSVRAISDLERGVNRRPQHETLRRITAALRLPAADRMALALVAGRPGTATASAPPEGGHVTTSHRSAHPRLVGRSRELALLERRLRGEGPPLLLLAGEPGIGKTRLLQEATARAAAYGLRVLADGCQRCDGQEPYAPLLGALAGYIRGQPPAQVRADLRGCARLVRLLPELADDPIAPLPADTLRPEQERRLLTEAVRRFLANVAGPAGTLLVLDDLQWAGQDALDLLAALVRHPAPGPLYVIGAYRDTELQPEDPLCGVLADLAQAGLVTHHELAPLVPSEVAELFLGLLEGRGAVAAEDGGRIGREEQIARRSGGVPFFVVSCAQAMLWGQGGEDAIPWDVTQSVRRRVAALSESARAVLGTAAVIGRTVAPEVLLRASDQPEPQVLAALEAACRARLLVEVTGEAAYRFSHDVIREVVEADLGAARRLVLHERIGEALERAPGSPVEALAYHYAHSARHDKALVYLEQAGDRAYARGAHAAAEGYYRSLVDRLDRMDLVLESARARLRLGAVLAVVARYDAALAVLAPAADAYRSAGDLHGLARTVAAMAPLYATTGALHEGVRRLQALVAPLEAAGVTPGLAEVYGTLANLLFLEGRFGEQLAAAERALDLAGSLGNNWMQGYAQNKRGLALLMLGHLEDAWEVLEESIQAADARGEMDNLLVGLGYAAIIDFSRGHMGASTASWERVHAIAERSSNLPEVTYALAWRGYLAFIRGAWGQAREDAERAAAVDSQLGGSWATAYRLLFLGHLHMATGGWAEAAQALEEAIALTARIGDRNVVRSAHVLLAERDVLEGRPEAACARLTPLLDRPGREEWSATNLLPVLAWAHLELDNVPVAMEVVTQAITRAQAQGYRLALVDALRVQALVATRLGRWDMAAQALEEGLSLARRMPFPYAEGRLLQVYGQMCRQKGKAGPAQERLQAALTIFQRLGAREDAERVDGLGAASARRDSSASLLRACVQGVSGHNAEACKATNVFL